MYLLINIRHHDNEPFKVGIIVYFILILGFIAGPYVSNLHGGSADLQCVSSRLRGHTQDTERARQNLIANSTDSIIGAVQFDRSTNAPTNLDIACSLCFLPEKSTQVGIIH